MARVSPVPVGGSPMPVHDWTCVIPGIFHDFHVSWIAESKRALNAGLLPAGYYALAEQIAGGLGPDVLTLQHGLPGPGASPGNGTSSAEADSGGIALATSPGVRNLWHLDLLGTTMGARGAKALEESPHLGQLRYLSVPEQAVGKNGMKALKAHFGSAVVEIRPVG